MVVDDDVGMLRLLEIVLRRHSFTVAKAMDACTALSLLDTQTPDLFILDVMMPDMDGIELCKRLRALPQTNQTTVIILSPHGDAASMAQGLQAGADVCLPKTTLPRDLASKVRKLLGLEAAEAQT